MKTNFSLLMFAFAVMFATAAVADDVAYVGSGGTDSNYCNSPVQAQGLPNGPCATFTRALSVVSTGGMILCNGPGDYGTVTITKSVTIDCQTTAGNARRIAINAPVGSIRLRNLGINGNSIANTIEIIAAASVEIDNVAIISPYDYGIYDHRTGPGKLAVSNSVISTYASVGVLVVPQGNSIITAVLDNVQARNSQYGLAAGIGARVMVTRSTFSQNFTAGVEVDTGAIIDLDDTLISNNPTGIVAGTGSFVSLANSRINSNNTGISGPTRSFGNNRFVANAASDGTPPTPFGTTSADNGQR